MHEKDVYYTTKAQLLANMDSMMGGRAAEELIYGTDKITTGASSDLMVRLNIFILYYYIKLNKMYIYLDILFFLQEATKIAETMVKSFGMSDKVGFRSIMENKDFFASSTTYAPSTNEIIDNEVKRLLQVNFIIFCYSCLVFLLFIRFMSHSPLFIIHLIRLFFTSAGII